MYRVYSRLERKKQIVAVFQWGGRLTAYDVARVLNMKPSTHLYKMMDELVGEGELRIFEVYHRADRTKLIYYDPTKG